MRYHNHRTQEFKENFKKLTQKNKALEARLVKKIRQILDNPFIGDPKRHELKHARGSHVDPYVIVYVVKGDTITFLYITTEQTRTIALEDFDACLGSEN